ncbi:MAG: Holliday junction branch migration DNA helicase RuvB, partial [Streptococcaceae bacterium]|nr:Holliday junction branch migration DNA helicase RuvB [Streptococcaceae bacterium]
MDEERIIDGKALIEDGFEKSLRPQYLSQYIGQNKV